MSKEVGTVISLTFLAIILYLILSQSASATSVIGGSANAILGGIHELQTGQFVSSTGTTMKTA